MGMENGIMFARDDLVIFVRIFLDIFICKDIYCSFLWDSKRLEILMSLVGDRLSRLWNIT